MVKKTFLDRLRPNDFGDFLSIISMVGFLAIFFQFALNKPFLAMSMVPLFLIVGGAGMLFAGKVFTLHKWGRDGIQKEERTQFLAITFGFPSMIIGVLLLAGVQLSLQFQGIVGFLSLAPAIFIGIDYIGGKK